MKRYTIRVDEIDPAAYPSAVLCRDVTLSINGRNRQIRRGTPLEEVRGQLSSAEGEFELHVVVPDDGDITQEAASERIATEIAGDGLHPTAPHQGQVDFRAATFGILRVDAAAVERLNQSGLALIATGLDGRVVQPDETVGIVKAPELLMPAAEVDGMLKADVTDSVIAVKPFVRKRVALIAGERIRDPNLKVSRKHLAAGLERFGAELSEVRRSDDEPEAIAHVYGELLASDIELILVAGSIVLDPEDPYLAALDGIDARLVRRGAPIDPGTMFWVAYADGTPIFGLASCEMYGKLSIFELFLPFALAGEPITNELISRLGYGGLLNDTQLARRPGSWRE